MSKALITSISFFCILILGNFVLLPRYQNLRLVNAQIASKQQELASKKDYTDHLKSLKRNLDKHSEELAKIDFALPSEPKLAPFLEFIQGACSENRLVLKRVGDFSTASFKGSGNIKETQIGFETSGTFEGLLDFLSVLEKSARLIKVSQVSFESPEEGDIFSFRTTVTIHSY